MDVVFANGDNRKAFLKEMPKSKKTQRSGIVAWPNLEANLAKWVRI